MILSTGVYITFVNEIDKATTHLLFLSFLQVATPVFLAVVAIRQAQTSKGLLSVPDHVLRLLLVSSVLLYYHFDQVQNTINIFLVTNYFPATK